MREVPALAVEPPYGSGGPAGPTSCSRAGADGNPGRHRLRLREWRHRFRRRDLHPTGQPPQPAASHRSRPPLDLGGDVGAGHHRCNRHRRHHPQALGDSGSPHLSRRRRRLRQGAQQCLGLSLRPAPVTVRLPGLRRCAGAVPAASGAPGGRAPRPALPQPLGPVPAHRRHGRVQPGADGGDAVQDQGHLRLLHPLGPAEPLPAGADPARGRLGRQGPAHFPGADHGSARGYHRHRLGQRDGSSRCGHRSRHAHPRDLHHPPGGDAPGRAPQRQGCRDVFRLLVPPLPRTEGAVRQGGQRQAQDRGVRP